MLSELKKNKMKKAFLLFDANHDGFVESSDIDQIIQNIANAQSADVNSDEYAGIKSTYSSFWAVLATMDSDGDGRVSQDEWLAAMENIVQSSSQFDEIIGQLRDVLFTLVDADGDGFISAREYSLWLTSYHETEDAAANAFSKLDSDGDGRISKDEMNQIVNDFFNSDDPSAPGNWLIGDPG